MTKFVSTPPFFVDHTVPNGCLVRAPGSQACWHFYTLAQKIKEKVGDSTEDQFGLLETDLWMDTHYVQLARSVALIHGLASPDEFMNHWPEVTREAQTCGLPIPSPVYTRPLKGIVLQ